MESKAHTSSRRCPTPSYEYICESCDKTCEVFHAITAPALTDCPACGEPCLRRVPQAGLPIGIFEPLHLESYGAPNDRVRKQQEREHGFEFDSGNRLVVRSPKELQKVKKIFGDDH